MASDVEEPEWYLIDTLENVEVRQYAPSIEARTVLDSSSETSTGFRRLAGFIFGGNDKAEKIAMTAPVQETLQDAAPVMAFTLPRGYDMEALPEPDDDRVEIVEVPARTVAVIGFSGWATRGKVTRYATTLLETLDRHDLAPVGGTILNQYNPPWTPPFLRRNEIAVEVAAASLAALNSNAPGGK